MPRTPDELLQQSPLLPASEISQEADEYRLLRVAAYEQFARTLNGDQHRQLKDLLAHHAAEQRLRGAVMGMAAERRESRKAEAAVNTRMTELLEKAAADNAALRARAHQAEQALESLRATLPGIERVVRGKIIAAAHADHLPLPKVARRSGVFYRYLSHGFHVRRIAQRIEEYLAGPDCRGYCRPEKLAEALLPESPASTYQQAITHLLLSKRIKKTASGAYRLTNPRKNPPV